MRVKLHLLKTILHMTKIQAEMSIFSEIGVSVSVCVKTLKILSSRASYLPADPG